MGRVEGGKGGGGAGGYSKCVGGEGCIVHFEFELNLELIVSFATLQISFAKITFFVENASVDTSI